MTGETRSLPAWWSAVAWAGSAAFAASAAFGVWSYLVAFGPAGPAGRVGGGAALAIDAVLFAVFAAHHSVMARPWAKAWLLRRVPAALERPLYMWVASGLLALVFALWQPVPGQAWRWAGPWAIVGAAIQGVGVLVFWRSAVVLDLRGFAGLAPEGPPVAGPRGDGALDAEGRHPITLRGPYAWVRHPIYLGTLLMMLGVPTMTGSRLAFTAFTAAYVVVAIPWEERTLAGFHGSAYRDYQRRVRWRLVPGLY